MVTIVTPAGDTQRITTTGETIVLRTAVETLRNVHAGARVVVWNQPDSPTDAVEVVVLPAERNSGVPVVAVAPDSLTTKNLFGRLLTVNTTEARIDKATTGTVRDVTIGSTIVVRGEGTTPGTLAADEIIVMPDGRTFGI